MSLEIATKKSISLNPQQSIEFATFALSTGLADIDFDGDPSIWEIDLDAMRQLHVDALAEDVVTVSPGLFMSQADREEYEYLNELLASYDKQGQSPLPVDTPHHADAATGIVDLTKWDEPWFSIPKPDDKEEEEVVPDDKEEEEVVPDDKEEEEVVPDDKEEEEVVPDDKEEGSNIRTCPHCGNELPRGRLPYCPACAGSLIDTPTTSGPALPIIEEPAPEEPWQFDAESLRQIDEIYENLRVLQFTADYQVPNYYTLLGVEQTASDDEIKRAIDVMLARYQEANYHISLTPRQQRQMTVLNTYVQDAYRALLDPSQRHNYNIWLSQPSIPTVSQVELDAARQREATKKHQEAELSKQGPAPPEKTAPPHEYEVRIDSSRSLMDQFPDIQAEAQNHRVIALTLNPAMTQEFMPEIIEQILQTDKAQNFVSDMKFNSFSIHQNNDGSLHFTGNAIGSYVKIAMALGKNKPTSISGNIRIVDGVPQLADVDISIEDLSFLGKAFLKGSRGKVLGMIQNADILKGAKTALANVYIAAESIDMNIIGDSIRIVVNNNPKQ